MDRRLLWTLFACAALLWTSMAIAIDYETRCREATVCAGSNCHTETYCWVVEVPGGDEPGTGEPNLPGGPGGPGGGLGGIDWDANDDGKTDCWQDSAVWAAMSSEYGASESRPGGWHFGSDITSTSPVYQYGRGSPIRSIADGTVSVASSDQWNGNYVKINHDDGRASYYLHLLDDVVAGNQQVSAGDIIGHMNCTGNCFSSVYGRNAVQGTHLHLEIRTTHTAARDEENHATTIDAREYLGTCTE